MTCLVMLNEYSQYRIMSSVTGHYGLSGLSGCSQNGCASPIIQIVIVGLMLLWTSYEFVMQLRARMRANFSWQEILLVLIFLCLSFNICFSVWSNVLIWYILEALLFQIYFTTLVYYFIKKYVQKRVVFQQRKPYLVLLIIFYMIFCLSQLGIFIFMVNSGQQHCKQIGQIIINGLTISLGILFFYLAYQNQTQQLKKFKHYQVDSKVSNPLTTIWIWVACNIIGQIISEVQSSLIYGQYNGDVCYPVQDSLETQILSPIFLVSTYGVSFCSTLWFYNRKRQEIDEGHIQSTLTLELSQADLDNKVELIRPLTSQNDSILDSFI